VAVVSVEGGEKLQTFKSANPILDLQISLDRVEVATLEKMPEQHLI
jgi:hypothetical protein